MWRHTDPLVVGTLESARDGSTGNRVFTGVRRHGRLDMKCFLDVWEVDVVLDPEAGRVAEVVDFARGADVVVVAASCAMFRFVQPYDAGLADGFGRVANRGIGVGVA